jgi:endoglucanase Acf2
MGREADRVLSQPDTNVPQFQQRSPRPQFHYFYGSTTTPTTETTSTTSTSTSNLATKPRKRNQHQLAEDESNQQEQDSLVGEELVSTDNEAELLRAEYQDLLGSEVPTGGDGKQNGYHGMGRNGSGSNNNGDSNSRNTSYYVLCNILVFVLIAGAMSTLVVLLIPHSSDPLPQTQKFTVPYKNVDRADFGDPPEGFLNMDLFHPALITSTPPTSQGTFIFPFPTGAFWTNLVVVSPIGDMSYPIVVYPYAYRWSSNSLEVSYPVRHRITDAHTITDAFAPDLTLTTVEEVSKRHVTAFDPLSVTLRFVSSVNSKWETALVQGSPYVTCQYVKETPILKPLSIFSTVQCPGDDEENFSDFDENDDGTSSVKGDFDGSRRQLFGVCSLDVRSCI